MGWTRFTVVRTAVFSFAALGAGAILGMGAHQATLFFDNPVDKPYLIFAIIVAILTLLASMVLSARYSLRTHIPVIAVLAILWLALASYTTDRVGNVSCESLDGQTRPIKVSGTPGHYNAVAWCRELKAMEAFAWFDWILFMIAILAWIRLSEHEENTLGQNDGPEQHSERAAEEAEDANERFARRENLEAGYVGQVGYGGGQFAQGQLGNGMAGNNIRYVTAAQYQAGLPVQQGFAGGNVMYQQPAQNVVYQQPMQQFQQGYPVQGMQQRMF